MKVFFTGATGFVGSHMLQRLLDEGHSVRALVRDPDRAAKSAQSNAAQSMPSLGSVDFLRGDVVSGTGLDSAITGCDVVVHLVGIIVERGANTFEAVHHIGTRNVVEAAKRAGVRRFVHMSALGVRPTPAHEKPRAPGTSAYKATKWRGEEEVRRSGIPFCILRPSIIFGPGDGFVTQMIDVMRKAPLFRPVPGAGLTKFRPVFIGDVTFCFARALTAETATNQTVELAGADELSLNDVLKEIARCAGVRKPAVHIPMPLMFLGAAVMQTILPNPPVTIDQLRMLKEGSTCDIAPMIRIFGLKPRGFAGCGR
jgi:uncharacterized protein YbjT (DUF2867 family)